MHAWELTELALHLANRGHWLRGVGQPRFSAALGQYWVASKCRIDCWNRALKSTPQASSRRKHDRAPQRMGSVCHEILTSEILSRLWASVASAWDAEHGSSEAEPLAASVLNAHVDSTNRVLRMLTAGFTPLLGLRWELNRLRRQAQRWTDLLLGRFGWPAGMTQYAHDAARACEYADDFSQSAHDGGCQAVWTLLLASLRSTFRPNRHTFTDNAEFNARIAGAILACLSEESFSHADGFDWLWRLRLTSTASEASRLVDQLLEIGVPLETPLLG